MGIPLPLMKRDEHSTGYMIPDCVWKEAIRIRDEHGIEAATRYINGIISGETAEEPKEARDEN